MKSALKAYKGELIGKQIIIIKAKNKTYEKKTGKIIDETKNSLCISSGGRKLIILKDGITIELHDDQKSYVLQGDYLIGRPEERIKKKIPKRIRKNQK